MKPTVAKMELLKLTCRNHGWRKIATYFLVMLLVCTTTCVQAATYYFTGTSDYADYTDVANWLVGGPEGTAATALPGPDDTLYTLSSIYADMSGGDYSVGKWGFSADWDHSPSPLYVKNGTLRITNDLTTHNGRLEMSDGGNIYVEGTYTPAIWDGGAHVVEVNGLKTYLRFLISTEPSSFEIKTIGLFRVNNPVSTTPTIKLIFSSISGTLIGSFQVQSRI